MKEKSLKINAVLNVVKTLMSLLFPLITYSYASRVLRPEGIGRFNFSNSVVSYFLLLAGLGVATYGVREGAKIREDKVKIKKFCDDLFSINVYATSLAYILLIAACWFVPKLQSYTHTILLLSLQIILTTLSVHWICGIFEEFVAQAVFTICAQLVSLVFLFLFVRTPDDLNRYAAISVLAYSGYGIAQFFYARKYVRFAFCFRPDLSHMKRILIIFSASVATIIYISSDVTILGWFGGDRYTGLYGTSANIYKIVKQLLNAVVAVIVPRFAFYLGSEQTEKVEQLGRAVMGYLSTLCTPAMVGLFFLSRPIVTLFAGEQFSDAAASLRLLSIALGFAVFANFFSNCVLLTYRKEMIVMIATLISAGVNVVMNMILIPVFYDRAAAFTTIVAEIVMCLIVWLCSRRLLKMKMIPYNNILSIITGCVLIAGICGFVLKMGKGPGFTLAVSVPVSVAAYGLIQIAMKNTIILEWLNNLKGRKQA